MGREHKLPQTTSGTACNADSLRADCDRAGRVGRDHRADESERADRTRSTHGISRCTCRDGRVGRVSSPC